MNKYAHSHFYILFTKFTYVQEIQIGNFCNMQTETRWTDAKTMIIV